MIAYQITTQNILIVVDAEVHTLPRACAQAKALIAELSKEPQDEQAIKELIAKEYSPELYSDGKVTINKDGSVLYQGEALPKALAEKVASCYEDGVPFEYVLRFFDRLDANPSKRAVEELQTFLEHKSMPITPDGCFLAYKGILANGYSCTAGSRTKVVEGETNEAGQILNSVGEKIRVKRNYVDDNKDIGCSYGLHAGSLSYATGFGDRTVIVKIDPADVVSIPTDCGCQKLRTCAYEVVSDYKGALVNSGVDNHKRPYSEDLQSDGLELEDDVSVDEYDGCLESATEYAEARGLLDAELGNDPRDMKQLAIAMASHFYGDDEILDVIPNNGDAIIEAYEEGYRNA